MVTLEVTSPVGSVFQMLMGLAGQSSSSSSSQCVHCLSKERVLFMLLLMRH
jgi:hypothetical protein